MYKHWRKIEALYLKKKLYSAILTGRQRKAQLLARYYTTLTSFMRWIIADLLSEAVFRR